MLRQVLVCNLLHYSRNLGCMVDRDLEQSVHGLSRRVDTFTNLDVRLGRRLAFSLLNNRDHLGRNLGIPLKLDVCSA